MKLNNWGELDRRDKEKDYIKDSKGHVWKLKRDSIWWDSEELDGNGDEVDTFAWSQEFCNGIECINCGYSMCIHCNAVPSYECNYGK